MEASVSPTGQPRTILSIDRSRIRPCRDQPRTYFDSVALQQLADSISVDGQKTPAEVRPLTDDPDHDYELTDGERRWRALGILGIKKMDVWVNSVANGDDQFLNSVVANFGREDHTPMEKARAVQRLLAHPRFTDGPITDRLARVAKLFAKSGAWASMHLNLLDLHPEIQAMLEPSTPEEGRLGLAMANFLRSVEDKGLQLQIAQRAVKEQLTLNQARRLARKMAAAAGARIGSRQHPSDAKRTLERFLLMVEEGTDTIMELPKKTFLEMVRGMNGPTRKAVIAQVAKSLEQLHELKEALERASS